MRKIIFNYNTKSQIIDILCDSSLDSFINNSRQYNRIYKIKGNNKKSNRAHESKGTS